MDDTLKLVGPDFSYSDALNHLTQEALKKEREEGKDIQKMPLRPSSSGNCERELAYSLNEYRGNAKYDREVINPETSRIFSLGHSVEYNILGEMYKYYKDLFQIRYKQQILSYIFLESKIKPEWSTWIEGSTDFVLWSEKFKSVGDIKSKKEKYSSYRESDWDETNEKYGRMRSIQRIGDTGFYADDVEAFLLELNDPFVAANVLQLNLYACNPFLKERGIDHAFLLYYSKNTSRLRELRFKPSQKLYDYVLQKFTNAFEAVEQGNPELAQKEFKLGSMKCAFCNFKNTCWSDADPLKMWFKSLPPKAWPTDTHRLDAEDQQLVEQLYADYVQSQDLEQKSIDLDAEICHIMVKLGISKLRFPDGNVYEVKFYKSPKEHYRLKRSK